MSLEEIDKAFVHVTPQQFDELAAQEMERRAEAAEENRNLENGAVIGLNELEDVKYVLDLRVTVLRAQLEGLAKGYKLQSNREQMARSELANLLKVLARIDAALNKGMDAEIATALD